MFTAPPVGANVVVITKHIDYYYYRTSNWRLTEYLGKVLQREKWDGPNTFRMTGDASHHVRVICLNNVETLIVDGTQCTVSSNLESSVKTVIVNGSKGAEYVVTISPRGNTCTCPAFVYRKMTACKHIAGALTSS